MANYHPAVGPSVGARPWSESMPGSLSMLHPFETRGSTKSSVMSASSSITASSTAPSLAGPRVSLANLSESFGLKRNRRRKTHFLDEAPRRTYWESMIEEQRSTLRMSSGNPHVLSAPDLKSLAIEDPGIDKLPGLVRTIKFPAKATEITMKPRVVGKRHGDSTRHSNAGGFGHLFKTGASIGSQELSQSMKPELRLPLEIDPLFTAEPLMSATNTMKKRLGPQDNDSWISTTLSMLSSPKSTRRNNSKKKRHATFLLEPRTPKSPGSSKKTPSKRRLQRTATSYGVMGGRGVDEVLQRELARPTCGEGFSEKELLRMRRAFKRFKAADCSEVDRGDIYDILIHLGYFGATEDVSEEIAMSVSEFSTFSFDEVVEVIEQYVGYEREQFRDAFEEQAIYDDSISRESSMLSISGAATMVLERDDICGKCGLDFTEYAEFCRRCGEKRGECRRPFLPPETPAGKPQGRLPVSGIDDVMRTLGIVPLKGVILEVCAAAGIRQDDTLDFDGFTRFMAIFRVTEGFQREQITKAQKCFRVYRIPTDSDEIGEMDPSRLAEALIEMFGTHASAQVRSLVRKLSMHSVHEEEMSDSEDDESTAGAKGSQGFTSVLTPGANNITFHEFLIWARRVNDAMVENLQQLFAEGSGKKPGHGASISVDALSKVLCKMGYTLSPAALKEFLASANQSDHDALDFDEFVRFATAVQKTSGFTKAETKDLSNIFDRYDYNGNGEMESIELLDLLRYMGFPTSHEDVHRFLKQVDANDNASMDLHEFLRFLRIREESEYEEVQKAFNAYYDKATGMLAMRDVRSALQSMGYAARAETLKSALSACEDPQVLDIHMFREVAEKCRKDAAAEKRKRAGFGDKEYDKITKMFKKRCQEGRDTLEKGEFLWLLIDVGIPVATQEERASVFESLREARDSALVAGLDDSDLGDPEDVEVTLMLLLHFLRVYERQNESHAMTKEESAVDKARFTRHEVKEFRQIYEHWLACTKESEREGEQAPTSPEDSPSREESLKRMQRGRRHSLGNLFDPMIKAPQKEQAKQQRERRKSVQVLLGTEPAQGLLSFEALLLLLSSIKVQMNTRDERILKDKVDEISGRDDSRFDFADFLLVMRWIVDANFGNINSSVKNNSDKKISSHLASSLRRPPSRAQGGLSESLGRQQRRGSI